MTISICGIGEHRGQGREVERVVERVEHLDAHVAAGRRSVSTATWTRHSSVW